MTTPPDRNIYGPLTVKGTVAFGVMTGIGGAAIAYLSLAPLSRAIGLGVTIALVTILLLLSATVVLPWPEEPDQAQAWGKYGRRWEQPGLDSALQNPQFSANRALDVIAENLDALARRQAIKVDDPAFGLTPRQRQLLSDRKARPPSAAELDALIRFVVASAASTAQTAMPLDIPPALIPGSTRRSAVSRLINRKARP